MTARGRLIILSAPSGGGKTSLAQALLARRADVARAVTHTTRAPRSGEQDGVDYHFVTRERYAVLLAEGAFLEHAEVFGNRYGTSRAEVEKGRSSGKHVLLVIDWQGARTVRSKESDAVSIFLLPPSRAALEERLTGRGQDSVEVIATRMQKAAAEMSHYPEFDHVIINDDFDAACADLEAILDGRTEQMRALTLDPASLLT